MARTSRTPGRTQLINFFLVDDAYYFVDLPGYGFARVPAGVKKRWGPMVESYLATRPNLVLSVLITDSRHGPTELDLQMKEWLSRRGTPFIVVATKADKLSANKLRANLKQAAAALSDSVLIPYSAVTRRGADRIWKEITVRLAEYRLPEAN